VGAGDLSGAVGALDDVLTQIRKKGTPRTITISGNDVSLQYVDLQARLTNAEAQRNAMLALLQQARSVNDTIQIQNQLGQVTGQIEELKGQISFLDLRQRLGGDPRDHSRSPGRVGFAVRGQPGYLQPRQPDRLLYPGAWDAGSFARPG